MKKLRAEIPIQTEERLQWLKDKTGLSMETVIITALIYGTIEMKKWVEEDG